MSLSIRYALTLLLGSLSASVCASPSNNSSVVSPHELLRILMGLIFVLFIIALLSWIVKRLNAVQLGSSKGFESIGSMTLGPKEKMNLVKVGERYLLVGVGSGSINLLCDFGSQKPEGFEPQDKSSFTQIFKSAVGKA